MGMLSISIIVPVYNVEKYLSSCIDSVLNQSYSDFELLLVDDGSTDDCADICDSYARKDSRIRVFHKKNGGVSSARNVGLEHAKGEWVFFLDGDDLLPRPSIQSLVAHVGTDVDMVYGGIRKFDEFEEDVETIAVKQEGKISVEDALDAFIISEERTGDWHRYLFNRIYRLSIIQKYGLRFRTDIFYKEDGLFITQYLCRCRNNVVTIPDIVYYYRQSSNSAMGLLGTTYNPKLLTNVDSHGHIYRELKKSDVSKSVVDRELTHLFQNYDWIGGIMRRAGVYTKENKRQLMKRIIKNAGPVKTFYRFVILRYYLKIKRKLYRFL